MNRLYDYQTQTFNKHEQLEEVEKMIIVAFFALYDVTNRLKQIKCQKLYLATHSDFFEYMEEKWGLDKDTFFIQCEILAIVDDLNDAHIPVPCFSSLPIIGEYHNLTRGQRIELARKVMKEAGDGRVDKQLTHGCKKELFPEKCDDPGKL